MIRFILNKLFNTKSEPDLWMPKDPVAIAVDWDFIETVEGFSLSGYVPTDRQGNVFGQSGVTVLNGLDLGQQSVYSLNLMNFTQKDIDLLTPYLGLKKEDAVRMLKARPLKLSVAQGKDMLAKVQGSYLYQVISMYETAKLGKYDYAKTFGKLTAGQQTVIVSVLFQYGIHGIAKRCPRFWKAVVEDRWADVKKELLNFGDEYGTRRRREAALL